MGSSRKRKCSHPSESEREERDKRLFVYKYNQGGETDRRDNRHKPYPPLTQIRERFSSNKYQFDLFRDIGLGDLVMNGKERWRKHLNGLDLDGFQKGLLLRGLREIHHKEDFMDGRMDACLGYSAIIGAKLYSSIKDLVEDMQEEQKKRSFESWERMDVKRQLEDQILEGQKEIADLKGRVETLEFLVEKLTRPARSPSPLPSFRPASPLPDIGFPDDVTPPMEIPGLSVSQEILNDFANHGLTVNQQIVDDFLEWLSFDRTWPHGGYEADAEGGSGFFLQQGE